MDDPEVRFDFEGSLVLARRLWALAEHIEAMMADRRQLAERAIETWRGAYGREFGERLGSESAEVTSLATDLRATAVGWAACWQAAMEEHQRLAHAREVARLERERGLLERSWGAAFGDDLPPPPSPVAVPAAPHFHPTALVRAV